MTNQKNLIATRGTANLAVNGSITRQIFHIVPPPLQKWDITEITIYIIDDATTVGHIVE